MSRISLTLTRVVGLAVLALPAVAIAQPRTGVSRIIDARRALDLTARQLVQLDSIERVQFAERRERQERMVQRRDSLRRDAVSLRGVGRDSLRAIARARMGAMQPQMEQARRRDSISMAAAERVLTEPQRQRLREMRAEERGFQRGVRQARGTPGRAMPGRAMPGRAMPGRATPGRAMPGRMDRERPTPERRPRRSDER